MRHRDTEEQYFPLGCIYIPIWQNDSNCGLYCNQQTWIMEQKEISRNVTLPISEFKLSMSAHPEDLNLINTSEIVHLILDLLKYKGNNAFLKSSQLTLCSCDTLTSPVTVSQPFLTFCLALPTNTTTPADCSAVPQILACSCVSAVCHCVSKSFQWMGAQDSLVLRTKCLWSIPQPNHHHFIIIIRTPEGQNTGLFWNQAKMRGQVVGQPSHKSC